MPSLASVMSRRAPARLGDLAALGFNPSASPSLASLLASAGSVGGQTGPAPLVGGNVPAEQAPTAPNPRGVVAPPRVANPGAAMPSNLGDLAPVNLNAPPLPSIMPMSLGDIAQALPGSAKLHSGPDWGKIAQALLGITGDGLMAYGGLQPQFGPNIAKQKAAEQDQAFDLEKLDRTLQAKREDALRPRMEQVGNTIGMLDPRAQTYSPTFTSPGPAEQYAEALGHTPGTPEFVQAVRDYRLGSYSDPAMQNRLRLEGVRYENRDALQGERLGVTRRGQDLRYSSTTRGQDLTHGDRQAATAQSNTNNVRSTGTSRDNNRATNLAHLQTARRVNQNVGNEPVAVGPNGQKLVVRNGKWVPAQ
jgi:hypothetical protein